MKKDKKDFNVADFLHDHEINLNQWSRDKIGEYLKELNEMNLDKLPHFAEESIASIFDNQQKIIDGQSKLTKYIKMQQIVIGINFYVSEKKTFESYTNLIFEIKKLILLINIYKDELLSKNNGFLLQCLAMKRYANVYSDYIYNQRGSTNNDITKRYQIISKQYNMIDKILSIHLAGFENIDNLIKEYSDLLRKYENMSFIYLNSKIKSQAAKDIRNTIDYPFHLFPNYDYGSYCYYEQRLNILIKRFSSICGNNMRTMVFDELKLKLSSILLIMNSCKPVKERFSTIDNFSNNMESLLTEALLDFDTMNYKKAKTKFDNEFYTAEDIQEVKAIYEHNFGRDDFQIKRCVNRIMNFIHLKYITKLMLKKSVIELYNNESTREIIYKISDVVEYIGYNSSFHDLKESTKDYIEFLENEDDENVDHLSYQMSNGFHKWFWKHPNFIPFSSSAKDQSYYDLPINIGLLNGCFANYAEYLSINDIIYSYDVFDTICESRKYHELKFYLTKEILYVIYLISYTNTLVRRCISINHEMYDASFIVNLLTGIEKLYKNFPQENLDLTQTMQELYDIDEMKMLLRLANEVPSKESKLKLNDVNHINMIYSKSKTYYNYDYYSKQFSQAFDEMLRYFSKDEINNPKTLIK